MSEARQGALTHAPGKPGRSNCFSDGITDAYGVFVGAILRPNPKATLESTGSPLAGWDEIRHVVWKSSGLGCVYLTTAV